MSGNDYGNLIEKWKVELIERRARRLGFKDHEIPDLEQEIVLELLEFRFKEGPASESTLVTRIIDLQLFKILRSRKRDLRRANYEKAPVELLTDRSYFSMSEVTRTNLRLDIEAAMAGLSPEEEKICKALRRGENQASIARTLGKSRSRICEMVQGLRARLQRWGLGGF